MKINRNLCKILFYVTLTLMLILVKVSSKYLKEDKKSISQNLTRYCPTFSQEVVTDTAIEIIKKLLDVPTSGQDPISKFFAKASGKCLAYMNDRPDMFTDELNKFHENMCGNANKKFEIGIVSGTIWTALGKMRTNSSDGKEQSCTSILKLKKTLDMDVQIQIDSICKAKYGNFTKASRSTNVPFITGAVSTVRNGNMLMPNTFSAINAVSRA
jgi:hypothetical protein